MKRTERFLLALLTMLSLVSRLWKIGFPAVLLFDEIHFVSMAQWYVNRTYFFDIHPPLGKLCLAAIAYVTSFETDIPYRNIGDSFQGSSYIYLRAWQGLWGAALPPLAFLTARELGFSEPSSLLVGGMLLLELSLQTISRAVLLDSFLYALIAIAFLSALKVWRENTSLLRSEAAMRSDRTALGKKESYSSVLFWTWSVVCGLSMGCALSTKHTGLGVVGVVLVVHAFRSVQVEVHVDQHGKKDSFGKHLVRVMTGRMAIAGVVMVAQVIAVYLLCFVVHFTLLTHTGVDEDSMSDNFRSQLIGSGVALPLGESPQGMLKSIWELNVSMLNINAGSIFEHYHSCLWYQWPVLYKGIVYWWNDLDDGSHICLYLFGNPLIYWTALLGVFGTFYMYDRSVQLFFTIHRHSPATKRFLRVSAVLMFAYLANLLPYVMIKRTTFIYHYHPSLYFAVLLCGALVDLGFSKLSLLNRSRSESVVVGLFLITYAAAYWFYLPFGYGWPLTHAEHDSRRWFHALFQYW